MKIEICDLESEFSKLGDALIAQIASGKNIVLLQGNLGVGKTTLVKRYINATGGNDSDVDSPTFSIVNSYDVAQKTIYHFDLYRLNSIDEIEDIGFMEYIDSGNLCFIEWPEKIATFLPEERVLTVNIALSSQECREYSLH